MAINIVRIKNLEREEILDDVIIPVDKASYTDNAKQISISGLTDFVLSGFTGTTMIYKHSGPTTYSVGGIPVGSSMPPTGVTIQELFDRIFYASTTTTTTPAPTTTTSTTTAVTTTTSTTPAVTTTTSTTPAPTTTTTTTQISTTLNVASYSSDVVITDVTVNGISIVGASFPVNVNESTSGLYVGSGVKEIIIFYSYTAIEQSFMLTDGTGPGTITECRNVTGLSPTSTSIWINFPTVLNSLNVWAMSSYC